MANLDSHNDELLSPPESWVGWNDFFDGEGFMRKEVEEQIGHPHLQGTQRSEPTPFPKSQPQIRFVPHSHTVRPEYNTNCGQASSPKERFSSVNPTEREKGDKQASRYPPIGFFPTISTEFRKKTPKREPKQRNSGHLTHISPAQHIDRNNVERQHHELEMSTQSQDAMYEDFNRYEDSSSNYNSRTRLPSPTDLCPQTFYIQPGDPSGHVHSSPFTQADLMPPLGMARDMAEANEWSRRYGIPMNGLVPVPAQVHDEAGIALPISNNGIACPYTAVTSIFRSSWKGDGAHSSNRATVQGHSTNQLTLSMRVAGARLQVSFPCASEVLRVLGIGPYFGHCLPMCDLEQLARYHCLDAEASNVNSLTARVRECFREYYAEIGHDYLASYYACSYDVGRKPQRPNSRIQDDTRGGDSANVIIYDKFMEMKKANKGDCADAAARAVSRLNMEGRDIRSFVHNTGFKEAQRGIECGTLAYTDWSFGKWLDTHWKSHPGSERDYQRVLKMWRVTPATAPIQSSAADDDQMHRPRSQQSEGLNILIERGNDNKSDTRKRGREERESEQPLRRLRPRLGNTVQRASSDSDDYPVAPIARRRRRA